MFQPIYLNNYELNNEVWSYLSGNPNDNTRHILQQHSDKIDWNWISRNPNAISILEQNMDKINWNCLSGNINAIHLLEKNVDKINLVMLARNPNSIMLLFKINYSQMTTNNKLCHKELVEYVFHPNRLLKMSNIHNIEFSDLIDLY
jgi:hypothetical protein